MKSQTPSTPQAGVSLPAAEAAGRSGSRRSFLGRFTAATVAGGAVGIGTLSGARNADAAPPGDEDDDPGRPKRAKDAYKVRVDAAKSQRDRPAVTHPVNGDETRFPKRIGNYSKGLPHNALGEVDASAYSSLTRALASGSEADFEAILLGGTNKLTNPRAGLAFALEGADAHAVVIRAAPAFSSAEEAGEIVENYWMALLRDVRFADYATHPLAAAAATDLSRLSDFRGPKTAARVTPQTLFRGNAPGETTGPYLSQFMCLDTPFGAELVDRRMRTPIAGDDYMTGYSEWLAIQNGVLPPAANRFDAVRRYIVNGRDLSEWVHIDVLFQGYFNALLILFSLGAPFDADNPYRTSRTQNAFGTFGPPYMASLVCAIAREALKAVWFQKWFVHRRLRPEAFAGRIHNHLTRAAVYPIHADALNSGAVAEVSRKHGTFLLPMAFPEGCPTHPAYGAGHATVAGACVTVLKALFDEDFVIPSPVTVSADGQSLIPFQGPALTVGGELNKLASNVAIGRNIAGVHWRSDATESLKFGEELALRYLRDERVTFHERFRGFTLRKFDGIVVTV
jgi:hypothetical protein